MKSLIRSFLRMAALVVVSVAGLSAAWAEAPSRVARLSEFAGEVQLANEREDWHPITRNFAVTAGDNLWISDGGRAELDVGALQLWLAGGSNIFFERFDDQSLIARISQGSVAVRIRGWEAQDVLRILTPRGEIALRQPGFYVVNVSAGGLPNPLTALTVRSGQAEMFAGGPAQLISRGDTLVIDDSGMRFDQYANNAGGGFEVWATSRDRRIERWESRVAGTVSPWMIGARELNEYGQWDTDYEYGRVWYPTSVVAGWAPYRYGRWSWVQPWGWTWVDDAPWGFAPSHYGRWVRVGGRWGWCPGEYVARPIYAPALVTFFGGNGWSVGGNTGPTYSWVPLGWNEPYVPWYTYSPNYWRQVNRPYVRNIAEEPWRPHTYAHAAVPGAITAIAGAAFIAGRPVGQNYVRNIAERDLRGAPPARMGEVLPQAQVTRPGVGPAVNLPPIARSGEINRFPAATPGTVRERGPLTAINPNTSVLQPRVWQDPNPVGNRQQVAPSVQGMVPQTVAPRPQISENPGMRAPAIPMPKDARERVVPRADVAPEIRAQPQSPERQDRRNIAPPSAPAPQQQYAPVPVAPAAPQPSRAVSVPQPQQPRVAPPAPVSPPPPAPPRVVEQRAAPAVIAPVAPPPQPKPAVEPRQPREKDRAPVPQQQ